MLKGLPCLNKDDFDFDFSSFPFLSFVVIIINTVNTHEGNWTLNIASLLWLGYFRRQCLFPVFFTSNNGGPLKKSVVVLTYIVTNKVSLEALLGGFFMSPVWISNVSTSQFRRVHMSLSEFRPKPLISISINSFAVTVLVYMQNEYPTSLKVQRQQCSASLAVVHGHWSASRFFEHVGAPGVVLPYISYIGMCGPKGYGFSAVLVINQGYQF